jgi:hypothetical protein
MKHTIKDFIEPSEKVEILRQLLSQFWNEAIHWREDSWRFTRWLVASFIVLSGISIYSEKGFLFVSLILLVLSIGGTFYLRKNYVVYKDRLQLFCNIEKALLLFEDDAYLEGDSVISKDRLTAEPRFLKQGIYILTIWMVAVVAWVAMWGR